MEDKTEYTEEEKKTNGNQMYGGKRHDQICDELERGGYSDGELNLVSVGIWKGIESERKIKDLEIDHLQKQLDKAKEGLRFYADVKSWEEITGTNCCLAWTHRGISCGDFENIDQITEVGGKLAREILKGLEE